MTKEKQLIKLEDELSIKNGEYFKKYGCVNPVMVILINDNQQKIKENVVGAMI